ncbi:unnamed protein product [Rhodiola kirilowii]
MSISISYRALLCVLLAALSHFPAHSSAAGGYNTTKKVLNPVDKCWRADSNWSANRKKLADCAVGFGKDATGGKFGAIYIVTNNQDDAINPKPGSLRYGVIQDQPLWIIFANDMVFKLQNELMVNSYKTIDGRGVKVEISQGPCITITGVSHVIIHGISVHDCKPGKAGLVRNSPKHFGERLGCDGDAIKIMSSTHIWVDHCFVGRCSDGLIDVTHASTAVSLTNNYLTQHDKVMLLGHNDKYSADKIMKVTVAFNNFGPGLIERMPRVRFGYAHVANNRYNEWLMYAIGGSANPTIFSEGNYFAAPTSRNLKQVTKRETSGPWKSWKWRSSRDVFQNGAYFVPSGYGTCVPGYTPEQRFTVADGSAVPGLTADAGPLNCVPGKVC